MTRHFLTAAVLNLFLLCGVSADKAPDFPITLHHSDGTIFPAMLFGDEWLMYAETLDGFTIVNDRATLDWFYAKQNAAGELEPTSLRVGSADPDAAGLTKHIRRSFDVERALLERKLKQPPLPRYSANKMPGEYDRPLVLLVDFPGAPYEPVYSTSEFYDLLFNDNPTGTMDDYFNEISLGQFNISSQPQDVVGWVTAPQTYDYYVDGQKGMGSDFDKSAKGLLRDLALLLDTALDFSPYDRDGDGYVDAVILIPVGERSGSSNEFWPHVSGLGGNAVEVDGVFVSSFVIIGEVFSWNCCGSGAGEIHPIGTYAHEYGHILGLPDLYDTSDNSEGIGDWGLMGGGGWNSQTSPAHMSAWSKVQLGWIEPVLLESSGSVSLSDYAQTGEVYKLWIDAWGDAEYFLLSNRQMTGFDQHLNNSGLLIWHIDDDVEYWRHNVNPDRYGVGLMQADGDWDLNLNVNRGDDGDPFPGSTNNRTFNDFTDPGSDDYDGFETGISILNISNSAATMTFDVTPRQMEGYIIQYDEGGPTGGYVWNDSWGGVNFASADAGTLEAVKIYLRYPSMSFELEVYNGISSGTPDNLLTEQSGGAAETGWLYVELDEPVKLNAGEEFFVTIRFIGGDYPIPIDYYGVMNGNSYVSPDGMNYYSLEYDVNTRAYIRTGRITAVEDDGNLVELPGSFSLEQNHPNPFNPVTDIRYSLPQASVVTITVYNILGEVVQSLIDRHQPAGSHKVAWNAGNAASGVYIYRITAGDFVDTKKMVLLK